MKRIKDFTSTRIENERSLLGGGSYTGAGQKVVTTAGGQELLITYGDDYSSWSLGATSWSIKYYLVTCHEVD